MKNIAAASGVVHLAYGVLVEKEEAWESPYAFDEYDLWFGDDYNYFLDNQLEDFFVFVEEDIEDVRSSNYSEQISQ